MVVASSTSIPPSSSSAAPNTVVAPASINGKPHIVDDKSAATAPNVSAATADQTILTTTQEENDLIGREFVRQYFTILGTKPEAFHRFYNNDSQLIVNGSVYTGTTSIKSYVTSLNLHDCHTRIYQIAVTKPDSHSILVQILGEMSINRGPLRRFAQNVILSSFVKRKLYVAYDNFQYIDQAFSQICVSYGVESVEPYSENTCGESHTKAVEDFRSADESIEKSKITSNPIVAVSSIMDAKAPPFIPSSHLNASDQLQQQHQISSPSNNKEIDESIINDQKSIDNSCLYAPKMTSTVVGESMVSQQEFHMDESKLQPTGFNNLSYAGVAANSRLPTGPANITPMTTIPYGAVNLQSQSAMVGVAPHGAPYLNQHNSQIPHMTFVQEVKGIDLHDVNGVPIINSSSQVAAMNNGPCTTTMYVSNGEVYGPGLISNHRRNQSNMSYTNPKYSERYRSTAFSNGRNASPRAGDAVDLEFQIFIRSVPRQDMRKELIDHFSKYGNVADAVIVAKDAVQNNFFAFVTYEDVASAKKALLCKNHILEGNIRLEIEQRRHKSRFINNYGNSGMMTNGHRMPHQHNQHFSVGSGGKGFPNPRNVNPARFNAGFSSLPHGGGSTGS